MIRLTLPLTIIAVSILSGCATNMATTRFVEVRSYEVAKNTQVQLVASDLAVELGVDGVEWNNHLKPWSYKTLRTRTISLSELDKQQAYISLFADTGLLPHYDSEKNRVFIEPYKTQIKQTYNFEPAFTYAATDAKKLNNIENKRKIEAGENHEYTLYQKETLQDSLNAWGKEGGYSSIIWYIKDAKQARLITKLNRANVTVVERSPIYAINAILENINSAKLAPKINLLVDTESGSLVFHGMSDKEPLKVFTVDATSTKQVIEKLAKAYGAEVSYKAPEYRIKDAYKTVITNRIQLTLNEIMAGYPVKVFYEESTNKIKVSQ